MLKLLGNVLTAPVKGPIRGFEFIVNAIRDEVESEAFDEDKVKGELMQLELRYQSGEIDDTEFQEQEDALLERLNEIHHYKEELAGVEEDPASVEVEAAPNESVEDSTQR